MPSSYIPPVRARQLGRTMQRLRERSRLSQRSVGAQLGWSAGKVGHIETARTKAAEHDVRLMLDLYGVTDEEREAALALIRCTEHRSWWSEYSDIFDGPYVALEDAASEIDIWHPQVIPGLLQTHDYAREIIRAGRPDEGADGIERRLRARVNRQTLLTREHAPHLHVVLDEAVLERPMGGQAVMREQLQRLSAEARRPNVTIQILPKRIGTHAGLEGPLVILRFAQEDLDVAYTEGIYGAVYLENLPQITRCRVAMDRLRKEALSPDESAAMIDNATRM